MYKVITSKTIFYEFCKFFVNMFNQCFYEAFIISVSVFTGKQQNIVNLILNPSI